MNNPIETHLTTPVLTITRLVSPKLNEEDSGLFKVDIKIEIIKELNAWFESKDFNSWFNKQLEEMVSR
jgi:hypothetical protein